MRSVHLGWFTTDEQFKFFIQYGGHEEDMYVHHHVDFSELVIVLHGNATHIVNTEESFIKKGTSLSLTAQPPMDIKIRMNFVFATSCISPRCWNWRVLSSKDRTGTKRFSFWSRITAISTTP